MSEKVGSIHYELDLDDKKFNDGMQEARDNAKSFQENITDVSKKLAIGLGAAGAAGAVFAKKSVDAYNIQAEAEAKLTQLHKLREGVTDDNVQQLKDLASATQKVGIIGDEAIITGQAQLATFQLSTDAIKTLTPAMADMVAQQAGVNATGDDFVNIGNLMGKVLSGQVGALGRYGVSFSAAQEEILKTGTETEKAAALAEVLGQNYGGVNEALRDTFEGQMKAAQNTMGDFSELVGGLVVERIEPLITAFNDWADSMGGPEEIMKKLTGFVEEHGTKIEAIAIGIAAMLVPAFVSWGIAAGLAAIATIVASAPLILLGVIVAGLAYLIITHWDEIKAATMVLKDTLVKDFTSVSDWFEALPDRIKNALSTLADVIYKPFNDAWNKIKDIVDKIHDGLDKINPFHRNSPSLVDNVLKGVGIIKDEYSSLGNMKVPSISNLAGQLGDSIGGIGNGGLNQSVSVSIGSIANQGDIQALGREFGYRTGINPTVSGNRA